MKNQSNIKWSPLDEIVGTSDNLVPQYIKILLHLICRLHGESTIEIDWRSNGRHPWRGWGAYDPNGRITAPRHLTGEDRRRESVSIANGPFSERTVQSQMELLEGRLSPNMIRVSWGEGIMDSVLVKHFYPKESIDYGEWISQEETESITASLLA